MIIHFISLPTPPLVIVIHMSSSFPKTCTVFIKPATIGLTNFAETVYMLEDFNKVQ
jgi:hypothetical protein